MSKRRVRGIELADDLPFSRKSWTVERAGWIGLAAFLAAGFLGVLGPGLLSRVRAVAPGEFRAIYDRFGHFRSDTTLHVQVARAGAGEASVWIDDRYLGDVSIESVRPEPVTVRSEAGGSTYLFAAGGAGDVDVRFELTFQRTGVVKGRLGRSRDASVPIRQFVYP